jgi:hypothetical protein
MEKMEHIWVGVQVKKPPKGEKVKRTGSRRGGLDALHVPHPPYIQPPLPFYCVPSTPPLYILLLTIASICSRRRIRDQTTSRPGTGWYTGKQCAVTHASWFKLPTSFQSHKFHIASRKKGKNNGIRGSQLIQESRHNVIGVLSHSCRINRPSGLYTYR